MQEIKYEQESKAQSVVRAISGRDEFPGGKSRGWQTVRDQNQGGGKMHTIELIESQVIQLLEKGKVNAGSHWILNIDKEVTDHDPW